MTFWRMLIVLILFVPTSHADEIATWPQWRGPNRDGLITNVEPWPNTLQGEALQKVWHIDLGPSYSGPIVAADRVFVTETVNKKTETVRALDRKTGKQLWVREWPGAMSVPFFAKTNGDWIRSTPAYDGDSLYVAGMCDVLVCLNAATGSERWRIDFVKEFQSPNPDFGFVCSPLVSGDSVYVQAGGSFVKVDKKTGQIKWRTLQDGGGMYGSAFSSPVLAKINQQDQLLVQTRTKLAAVDSSTGQVKWSEEVPAFRGMNILTPSIINDSILTSSHSGGTFLYSVATDNTGVKAAWKQKYDGYMSSPIIRNGYAYLHLKNQRLTCIDLKTGKPAWTTSKTYGKYWSMVSNRDKILALDERGELYLIKANPEKYEQLDVRKVADDSWAHLAVCGNEIYIRDLHGLTVYRWSY